MSVLRPIQPDDFAAMFDISADYRVVNTVGSWPWPAKPAFTRMRLNTPEAQAGQVLAIMDGDCFAGMIGLVKGELGYMLGHAFWGRGLASRAVAEMLQRGFAEETLNTVVAGVFTDNPASARVLAKNGFEHTGNDIDFGKARGCNSEIGRYVLSRARWQQHHGH